MTQGITLRTGAKKHARRNFPDRRRNRPKLVLLIQICNYLFSLRFLKNNFFQGKSKHACSSYLVMFGRHIDVAEGGERAGGKSTQIGLKTNPNLAKVAFHQKNENSLTINFSK